MAAATTTSIGTATIRRVFMYSPPHEKSEDDEKDERARHPRPARDTREQLLREVAPEVHYAITGPTAVHVTPRAVSAALRRTAFFSGLPWRRPCVRQ